MHEAGSVAIHHDMDGANAKAFNLGCDARIRGESLSANPYSVAEDRRCDTEWASWRRGWSDINNHWPASKPLPPVKSHARTEVLPMGDGGAEVRAS